MSECEDYDLIASDLIRHRERKSIQYGKPAVGPIAPLRRSFREPEDRVQHRIDLVFRFGSEPGAIRLVVVDFVIDLGDGESVESKLQRRARFILR